MQCIENFLSRCGHPISVAAVLLSQLWILPGLAQGQNLQIPPVSPDKPIEPSAPTRLNFPEVDPFSLPTILDQEGIEIERFVTIERINFDGNTVIEKPKIREIVASYEGRRMRISELRQIELAVTKLYRDAGYVLSGAFIPDLQELDPDKATIYLQIVEGEISSLEINGARRLTRFVRKRIAPILNQPLSQPALFNRLRFLLNEEQIENLNVDIQRQVTLGKYTLVLNITPGRVFDVVGLLNNYRSPTVGTFERGATVVHRNLVGLGDTFALNYRNTKGSHVLAADYAIPLNAEGGSLALSYLKGDSKIVEEPFEPFNLESRVQEFAIAFEQPILRKSSNSSLQLLTLGVGAKRSESADTIDGFAFPITEGADPDGKVRSTVFNFFQNYRYQSRKQTLILGSDISVGVNLGSVNDSFFGEGEFVRWRGQGAYARRINNQLLTVTKGVIQVSNRDLVSNEQIILTGINAVRGFRQNSIARDNGFIFSNEMRIVVFEDSQNRFEVIPFIDLAHGFNVSKQFLEDAKTIVSVGLGIQYILKDRLSLKIEYGYPILGCSERESKDSLQEQGVTMGLQFRF